MRNLSFKIITLLLTIVFFSCASHKKINRLASKMECEDEFYFSLNDSSKYVKIEYEGDYYGNSKYPDYEKVFREAVEELAKSSNIDIKYKEVLGFPSNSIVKVDVKINRIRWKFKESSATMEADLLFLLPNKQIPIVGTNKIFIGGTKTGNLMKAIKDGTYQFLSSYCSK